MIDVSGVSDICAVTEGSVLIVGDIGSVSFVSHFDDSDIAVKVDARRLFELSMICIGAFNIGV